MAINDEDTLRSVMELVQDYELDIITKEYLRDHVEMLLEGLYGLGYRDGQKQKSDEMNEYITNNLLKKGDILE